ncbi:tetratricopeptide repeat protein 28-like [Physella acuta]|uniref:tetratricopeptide repeat protein 28-like n=1 Tax=Physella acuta TaxID=109671 RepID=UPI0027DE65FF|nr:tetratricopeptide repeat protein 28-like [Physella acuta]
MERLGPYTPSVLRAHSLHSLTDGNETISEAEEINEVKSLHNQGIRAAKTSDFSEALQCYNEALEIDSKDVEVLQARALVYLQQGKTAEALADADAVLTLDPNSSKGRLLQGMCYQKMNMYKSALDVFISALNLDSDNADKICNHIVSTVSKMCQLPAEITKSLKIMEPYEKLSEIGVFLYQHKKYEACISVLESSRKFQTNQKGITMRVLLTLANAHSQLLHIQAAIGLYQECLSIAVATHEQEYQTKALVNIATLHLENGDTHQAILFYEKLLHLKSELREGGAELSMPDFWTKELQCGIHLNLSIAYKTISNVTSAATHAKIYMELTKKFGMPVKQVADSLHNTGMLNEVLGNHVEALSCYREFLSLSQSSGNQKSIGQAYGSLASVNAALKNWQDSLDFHNKHIEMATRLKDRRMMVLAHEMMGDTLCLKGDYELAIDHYNQVLAMVQSRDNAADTMARCKLAAAYKQLGQLQYSLYYYNQALSLAQRFGLPDIETLAEFSIACINKDSTQYTEREEAQKTFIKLIPYFEKKVNQHLEENSHCPEVYEQQLGQCYDGMQTVLASMSNKLGCLQYAEAHRKRGLLSVPHFQSNYRASNHSLDSCSELWETDHLKQIVSQQNGTVLYYSLLDNLLLLWVLSPGEGIIRFYSAKSSVNKTFSQIITELLAEVREGWDTKKLYHTSEARALPLKNANNQSQRSTISDSTSASATKSVDRPSSRESKTVDGPSSRESKSVVDRPSSRESKRSDRPSSRESKSVVDRPSSRESKSVDRPSSRESKRSDRPSSRETKRSALRQLYEILIAPVEDILNSLKQGSQLVIVPDKQLKLCPFGALENVQNEALSDRFNISYVSCLLILEKVIHNELNYLRAQDELNLQRQMARNGGVSKYTREHPELRNSFLTIDDTMSYTTDTSGPINLREVSNPKLAIQPDQNTRGNNSKNVNANEKVRPQKYAGAHVVALEKLLATHTYSKVATRTWTDTDVTSSTQTIPTFQQISDQRTSLVFGSPKITQVVKINDQSWTPKLELVKAQTELLLVAEWLGTHCIIGEHATRQELLNKLPTAEIVHIATWACLREGLLLVTPDPLTDQSGDSSHPETDQSGDSSHHLTDQSGDSSHLVTISDIQHLKLTAKLVVMSSCGLSPARAQQECGRKLASAFLSAGAECVLVCTWPIPDDTLCTFLFHFYQTLQTSAFVSEALRNGVKAVKEDTRWNHVCHWAGFTLIGKDTQVSLSEVRHAELDQLIDRCEADVEESSVVPWLNPASDVPNFASKEENMETLQEHVKLLLRENYKSSQVIPGLIELLDTTLKRLHTLENNKLPAQLSDPLERSPQALVFLKWLGFHFQPRGDNLTNPYIIFPHWNTEELLIPAYDSLKAAKDLACSPTSIVSVCESLPLSQENLSCLIDLMSITKHAPEIQLKVTDLSVHPLWHNTKTRALLSAIGFHQVGLLLSFNMVPVNKQILVSLLQLTLSFSCYKSPVLLYRLDVNLLGRSSETKTFETDCPKLPSLMPLLLPKNQLRMSTPWLSVLEHKDEMLEKIKLARSATNLSDVYTGHLEKAKSWHRTTLMSQANERTDKMQPSGSKTKVKVKPGASTSEPCVPVDYKRQLTPTDIKQRRDYAHFVLQERVERIDKKRKDNLIKLYLPYIRS